MVVGENGLMNKAGKAADNTKVMNEKEAIELQMSEIKLNDTIGENNNEILGEKLLSRDINGSDWKILKIGDKEYGTGWYFINEGTEIKNYGKSKNKWMFNYNTGELIKMDNENYNILSAGDSVAVPNGLIFNLDASIIDNSGVENTKESIEKVLGDGVILENFDFNENSGINEKTFNFDGENDVIMIPYDNSRKFETGITLEFYGSINAIGEIDGDIPTTDVSGNALNGFLELAKKDDRFNTRVLDFGIDINNNKIEQLVWNHHVGHTIPDGFKGNFKDRTWDSWDRFLFSDYEMSIDFNNKVYFTVTIDGTNSKTSFYLNGNCVKTGNYVENEEIWKNFISNINNNNCDTIFVGNCSNEKYVGYSNISANVFRIYNRALTGEEVKQNYDKAFAYYN